MESIPDTISLCPMVAQELEWIAEDLKKVKEHRKAATKDLEAAVHDLQVDLQTLADAADSIATIKAKATDALNMVEHILMLYTAVPPREGSE